MLCSDSVVVTRERFAEVLVFALANSLVESRLSVKQKLTVINALLLGHTKQTHVERVFSADDFSDILESVFGLSVNVCLLRGASICIIGLALNALKAPTVGSMQKYSLIDFACVTVRRWTTANKSRIQQVQKTLM
jgi:hypothetical protein